jgi:hypothetical protein
MLNNEQLEKQLKVLKELKEVGTDDFFYTRLRARMGKELENNAWAFRLKPVWVMTVLLIMLAFNGWMLASNMQSSETTPNDDAIASMAFQYESNIVGNY